MGWALPVQAQSVGEVFRKVSPSVVVIRAKGREVTGAAETRFSETGAGVLVSKDGKVMTAAHVVHTMDEITVEFIGGEAVKARVVASEPAADLSLLQLDGFPRAPGRAARRLRQGPGRRPGHRGRRALRAELLAQRGLDQRALGAEHGVPRHAPGRVLPDRRGHQHRELGRADVQHER